MSPARRRHIALFSALGAGSLLLYCYPLLLYLTLLLVFVFTALYFRGPEALPARLGLNPRTAVSIQTELRRWVWAWGVGGASEGQRKFSSGKTKLSSRDQSSGPYRHEALGSESLLFSPRDLLMGSYIHKAESPPGDSLRAARATRNPREELRDRLARPNYAVYTPNRRLSFSGEPLGSGTRFTITPKRHYPLQQQGASPVGVLPPLRWDGFRQKSVLSPRNTSVSSPVTVKIARPDGHAHGLEHVCSPVVPRAEADPCSRESVLKVLRESRKREVEEERSLLEQQRSKRRRNDSGGSAQSAFEPLLPNGTSTQLIPKPGTLKRGLTAAVEDQSLKRSRTSSVSSSSGAATFRGTPSSRRNPISSSYSSTQGLTQRKRPLASASPRSSPGPSRSHTPECSSKKIREEEQRSPSPVPCVQTVSASGQLPALEESTSPKEPSVSSTERTQSGGKRRRKIQLVSRDDHLSLPPPPEIGYSITVQDLDEEKRSALSKIQKLLETPAPELAASSVPSTSGSSVGPLGAGLTFTAGTSSTVAPSSTASTPITSAGTVAGVLGAPSGTVASVLGAPSGTVASVLGASSGTVASVLGASSGTVASVLGASSGTVASVLGASSGTVASVLGASSGTVASSLGVSSATAPGSAAPPETNLLLESLKRKSASPVTAAVTASSAPVQPVLSLQTSAAPGSSSVAPPSTTHSVQPSAPSLFSTPAATAPSASTSLPAPGFKPVFNVSSSSTIPATDSKPLQNFKPIFGAAPGVSSSAAPVSTASVFGSAGSSTSASLFPPSTASSSAPLSSGSGFVTTLQLSSGSGTGLPSSSLGGTTFGQTAPAQSTSTAPFGVFGTTTTAAQSPLTFGSATTSSQSTADFGTTTSLLVPGFTTATTAPPTLTFGSTTSSQSASTFGATTTAPPALTFGATTTSSQSAPTFGTTTTTAMPTLTFGAATTSSQSSLNFGTSTTAPPALTFGSTTSQSATTFGMTTAGPPAPTFGATASSQSTFTFGKSTLETSSTQPSLSATAEPPKPFTFGALPSAQSSHTVAPALNPAAPTTAPSFGTLTKPAFSFGGSTAAAPNFGAEVAPQSSSTFTFGSTAPQTAPSNAQPSTPFKFGAAPPTQFGAPVNSSAPQMGTFTFGAAAADKPSFGTPTPVFGQTSTPAPIPFGSPGTPAPSFSAPPFGSPTTPSFSIGAGSKPSAARQRLQARRQHTRKK